MPSEVCGGSSDTRMTRLGSLNLFTPIPWHQDPTPLELSAMHPLLLIADVPLVVDVARLQSVAQMIGLAILALVILALIPDDLGNKRRRKRK